VKLEFVRPVVVDGQAFQPGQVVEVGGQMADYFHSCLRMGHAKKVESNQPKAETPKAKQS